MAKEYIEREAAKRELLSWAVCMNHPEYLMRDDALHVIDSFPAADVVEVTRCRECKWYMPGDLFTDIMFCHRLKKDNGKPAKYNYCEDDFCSYGERKDGVGND